MARKKENTEAAITMTPVDIGKLSHGLKTTFLGVSEVFDSIGAAEKPGFGVAEEEPVGSDEGPVEKESDEKAAEGKVSDETEQPETPADEPDEQPADEEAVEQEEVEQQSSEQDSKQEEPKQQDDDAQKFTLDDLMKVAATLIKKDNKKYSDKIGALVKTYGINSLRELPEEKFEAFMTDLSQL